ncbi:MAG: arginine--tRNA ligase, partial [Acidimicrobiia bacterium]
DALTRRRPLHLERVEIAGPGFLNLHLTPTWAGEVVRSVVLAGASFGHGDELGGQRINLEFVSTNPTGPIHAGGGRWAAIGDALANLLAARGAEVHREYLLNDAGSQLGAFGRSLFARYLGEEPPEDGYQGVYVVEMAERLRTELGDELDLGGVLEWGYRDVVRQAREDLERLGVRFNTWFSERSLHRRGDVDRVVALLDEQDHMETRDGARWLRASALGDTRDRVLVRSDGVPTYLAADLAYHADKFARGFNHLIDIWGADHHGQVRSLQVGIAALGFPEGEPEVILGQLVSLQRSGQPVRMSKRGGEMVTLADVLDEVDPDVCRLIFLLQGIDTAQTIDLALVAAQSAENPVYYLQYAHARIASISRRADGLGVTRLPLDEVDLAALGNDFELDLARSLSVYPAMVAEAAELRAPHRVTGWARDLAGRFHRFYNECRVVGEDPAQTQARLWLVEACRVGLSSALSILGVSAPEAMGRGSPPEELVEERTGPAVPGQAAT